MNACPPALGHEEVNCASSSLIHVRAEVIFLQWVLHKLSQSLLSHFLTMFHLNVPDIALRLKKKKKKKAYVNESPYHCRVLDKALHGQNGRDSKLVKVHDR